MGPSWWQLLVVLVLVVLLFGRGKISDLMGDVAKGIKSFKDGMADDDELQGVIEHEGSKVPAGAKSTPRAKAPVDQKSGEF